MRSHLRILALLPALALLLAASACSDTSCHDKLAADGGLVQSDKCTFVTAEDGDDAGNDGGNDDGADNNGAGNNGGGNNGGGNNGTDPDASDGDDTGSDPTDDADMPDAPPEDAPSNNGGTGATLVGDWISQGDDVAPILRQGGFEVEALTVTFGRDRTYVGELRLGSGDVVPYGGTFRLDDSTDPWSIVLTQTAPQGLTSTGIVALERDGGETVMRFEVVQTDPPTPGFQPPTPQGGFGSTRGVDDPADNIQVYRRP